MSSFGAPPASARSGSATMTVVEGAVGEARASGEGSPLTLSLSAGPTVTWGSSVVNNEGVGGKAAKRRCIYKKPKKSFDLTSSDESGDDGRGRPTGITRKKIKDRDKTRFHA